MRGDQVSHRCDKGSCAISDSGVQVLDYSPSHPPSVQTGETFYCRKQG